MTDELPLATANGRLPFGSQAPEGATDTMMHIFALSPLSGLLNTRYFDRGLSPSATHLPSPWDEFGTKLKFASYKIHVNIADSAQPTQSLRPQTLGGPMKMYFRITEGNPFTKF